jgi:hypothetical protein
MQVIRRKRIKGEYRASAVQITIRPSRAGTLASSSSMAIGR